MKWKGSGGRGAQLIYKKPSLTQRPQMTMEVKVRDESCAAQYAPFKACGLYMLLLSLKSVTEMLFSPHPLPLFPRCGWCSCG